MPGQDPGEPRRRGNRKMTVTGMAPSQASFQILGARTHSVPPRLSLPSWAGAVVTQP